MIPDNEANLRGEHPINYTRFEVIHQRLDPNPDPAKCLPDMLRVIREAYAPRPVVREGTGSISLDDFLRNISSML